MRTVWSLDAVARRSGWVGFQSNWSTLPVWPFSSVEYFTSVYKSKAFSIASMRMLSIVVSTYRPLRRPDTSSFIYRARGKSSTISIPGNAVHLLFMALVFSDFGWTEHGHHLLRALCEWVAFHLALLPCQTYLRTSDGSTAAIVKVAQFAGRRLPISFRRNICVSCRRHAHVQAHC